MCRLTAIVSLRDLVLIGDIVTKPKLSIIYQSFNCHERAYRGPPRWAYEKSSLNGDGFGVGWYTPPDRQKLMSDPHQPCLFRSLKPAWSDQNLRSIAEKVASKLIFAHVRAAGPASGYPTEGNCHPFNCGRFLFMHNGMLGNWKRMRKTILSSLKTDLAYNFAMEHNPIDSVVIFALFIDCLERGVDTTYSPNELRRTMEQTLARIFKISNDLQVDEESLLNCVVTDGSSVIATRYAIAPYIYRLQGNNDDDFISSSLYFATGTQWAQERDGEYVMLQEDKRHEVCIITSEPLTEVREEWVPVPHNHLMVVTSRCDVLFQPLNFHAEGTLSVIMSQSSATSAPMSNYVPPTQISQVSCDLLKEDVDLDLNDESTVHSSSMSGLSLLNSRRLEPETTIFQSLQSLDLRMPTKESPKENKALQLMAVESKKVIRASENAVLCLDQILTGEDQRSYLFAGDSSGKLHMWDPQSGSVLCSLAGHRSSILALVNYKLGERVWLFSASSDASVCVWDVTSLINAVRLVPRTTDVSGSIRDFLRARISFEPIQGDVLSLATFRCDDRRKDYILFGFQSTLMGLMELESFFERLNFNATLKADTPTQRNMGLPPPSDPSNFHDALDIPEIVLSAADQTWLSNSSAPCLCSKPASMPANGLEEKLKWMLVAQPLVEGGHCGFVECMCVIRSKKLIASGGGDGLVLLWTHEMKKKATLVGHSSGVLSLCADSDSTLYSGSRDQTISVWDIDSCCRKQILRGHTADIMALTLCDSYLLSASTSAEIFVWSRRWHEILITLHPGRLIPRTSPSAISCLYRSGDMIVSAGGDGCVRFWSEEDLQSGLEASLRLPARWENDEVDDEDVHGPSLRVLLDPTTETAMACERLLGGLIPHQSVSGVPTYVEDCWSAAKHVTLLLENLGASTKLIPVESSPAGPIVYGRLGHDPNKPSILLYSHYDVVAPGSDAWETDPWKLSLVNGYFRGRGVSDNKGPLIAQILAVRNYVRESDSELPINLIFLSEGAEETGSPCFEAFLKDHEVHATHAIFNNSYWLNDETPSIVHSMRGVVDIEITVSNNPATNISGHHSGIHGGAVTEPLKDLIQVLATLTSPEDSVIAIPELLKQVKFQYHDLKQIDSIIKQKAFSVEKYMAETQNSALEAGPSCALLRKRWLEPSLSITKISTSADSLGPENYRVIPTTATASVSIRIVPHMDIESVGSVFEKYIAKQFAAMKKRTKLSMKIINAQNWWQGALNNRLYRAAAQAVKRHWGVSPLLISEGGTMPAIFTVQNVLNAAVIQLPLGQSSDNAHLPNEKIRACNLVTGSFIIKDILTHLDTASTPPLSEDCD